MSQNNYLLDGMYEDIAYQIDKEILDLVCKAEQAGRNITKEQRRVCSELVAELLIRSEIAQDSEHIYERGWLINNGPYYLKLNLDVVKSLAMLIAQVVSLAGAIADPTNPFAYVSAGALAIAETAGLTQVLRRVPKESFCVLLCAHQMKTSDYVSINTLVDKLCLKVCPYRAVFHAAYGHYCKNHDSSNRCLLTENEVCTRLDELGKEFGVIEQQERKIYRIC